MALIAIGPALLTLASAASRAESGGQRQTASLTFTSSKPDSPSGIHFVADWVNPDDPAARPVPVKTIVTRGPTGAEIDTSVLPWCLASDTELLAEGAAACPAETKVGGGKVITDAGPSGPFPRYSDNTVSIFNNDHEQVNIAQTDNPPPIRAVNRSAVNGRTTTANIPPFPPGVDSSESLTSLEHLDLTFPALVRNGEPYFRTPPRCPRTREWSSTITFVYADGVEQQLVTKSPCRPLSRVR